MNILAVDTTYDDMVVALSCDGMIYSETSVEGAKRHNSMILLLIDRLLCKANINIKAIDYFAAVVGPGSFTGIRIGVSTLNALSYACGKDCVAINSLEELAYPYSDKEFYTAIDCRHDSFYYAKFSGGYNSMVESGEIGAKQLDEKNCRVVKKSAPSNPQSLIAIAIDRIKANQVCTILAPLYLKKSQAEREYDEKNMDKNGK